MEIIPVIHVINEEQCYQNIDTCISCGIKKVFLIRHGSYPEIVLDLSQKVKQKYPTLWVGINMLGFSASYLLEKDLPVDGLWSDDDLTHLDEDFLKILIKNRKFEGVFFGGLAFKYQKQPTDLALACTKAFYITNVATTSGDGTGHAPTLQKIKTIHENLDGHPLAIASGVNINNIELFKPFADYILVASSITDHNEIIQKEKLQALINKAYAKSETIL